MFYKLRRFYTDQISTRINPRQKWLSKAVGRHFVDASDLIPITLFSTLIFFVEKDDGNAKLLEMVGHPLHYRHQAARDLLAAYRYGLKARADDWGFALMRDEAEIHMNNIVKHRIWLWT